MSLKSRVLSVIEIMGEPVSTRIVANKMRMPPQRIASEISKLTAYGYLSVIQGGRNPWGHFPVRRYCTTGKPYPQRP
jgi:hypothetical protein